MGEAKSKSGIAGDGKRYVPLVDGGWGWVVVVGSFFIHVFADGIVYSFGVLFDVIMKVSLSLSFLSLLLFVNVDKR